MDSVSGEPIRAIKMSRHQEMQPRSAVAHIANFAAAVRTEHLTPEVRTLFKRNTLDSIGLRDRHVDPIHARNRYVHAGIRRRFFRRRDRRGRQLQHCAVRQQGIANDGGRCGSAEKAGVGVDETLSRNCLGAWPNRLPTLPLRRSRATSFCAKRGQRRRSGRHRPRLA